MNPFICGKYVCGITTHTLYSLLAGKEAQECAGYGPYHLVRYYRDEQGTWHAFDWRDHPFRPVPVTDQGMVMRLEQIRSDG